MKYSVLIFALLLSARAFGTGQRWDQRKYHMLLDGNHLYELCSDTEKSIRTTSEGRILFENAGAAQCWAYVEAVVDSIPEGEGFTPSPDIRLNQYIEVVRIYLKEHPSTRQLPAYYLTRIALTEAFPGSN